MAERLAHGPLASCDDVHTCPGGSAWAEAVSDVDAGWIQDDVRALARCSPMVRGQQLGHVIRRAKVVATDCIQGDTIYGSALRHSYLVAKYHEIASCGAVIAGNLPLSGHGSGLEQAVVELQDDMSDATIIALLQRAVADSTMLHRRADTASAYFAQVSYAHGVRYWSALLAQALQMWHTQHQRPEPFGNVHSFVPEHVAVPVPLAGVGRDKLGLVAMAHNPLLFEHRESQLLASTLTAPAPALSVQRMWTQDAHRSLVSAVLAADQHTQLDTTTPRRVMVDVGSGAGLSVLEAASYGWRVVALESLRSNVNLLREALSSNGWSHATTLPHSTALPHEQHTLIASQVSACAHGRHSSDAQGEHVCAVHAAVGGCELGRGGRVLVATISDDQGAALVLHPPSHEVRLWDAYFH